MLGSKEKTLAHNGHEAEIGMGVRPDSILEAKESPGVRRIKAMIAVMTRQDFVVLCIGALIVSYVRK